MCDVITRGQHGFTAHVVTATALPFFFSVCNTEWLPKSEGDNLPSVGVLDVLIPPYLFY